MAYDCILYMISLGKKPPRIGFLLSLLLLSMMTGMIIITQKRSKCKADVQLFFLTPTPQPMQLEQDVGQANKED